MYIKTSVFLFFRNMAEASSVLVRFCLSSPTSHLPYLSSPGAAGFDLAAAEEVTIPPHGHGTVALGICFEIPATHYGCLTSRSGLADKYGITLLTGTIDSDYRGPISAVLANHSAVEFKIKVGAYIAQIIFSPFVRPKFGQVASPADLTPTARGQKGFGSSGRYL